MEKKLKIKKVLFGGYNEIDTLTKFKELNENYKNLLKVQEEFYQDKINELEEEILVLKEKLAKAEK